MDLAVDTIAERVNDQHLVAGPVINSKGFQAVLQEKRHQQYSHNEGEQESKNDLVTQDQDIYSCGITCLNIRKNGGPL